ncbi:MAG: helix-turn-helix transcriptional regulator [Ruminococcaceae bacterium]|nr:helix-turn-helix transcriptional regulator [Oscillospiraceae bacterium]
MFEIDRTKFGAFVSALRKEKGYTQKELAEKLFISDKAISKWETGASIPDTSLLIPLADLLGITVTELLMCQRMEQEESLDPRQIETVVKTALTFTEEKPKRAYHTKSKWPVIYCCCVLSGILGTMLNLWFGYHSEALITGTLLCIIFGAYFCFFVKTKLPPFYDQNRSGLYYDGPVRMNIPGVVFTNTNWPHIVRVGRIWTCAFVSLYPIISFCMNYFLPGIWLYAELYVFLVLLLGGLFIPIYVVARKHEYA